ncbi:MAG: hypothetical protein JWQ11_1443 [Rhizobacter sp.]|nr:hypothetical protein [Rhizobacter sp.]
MAAARASSSVSIVCSRSMVAIHRSSSSPSALPRVRLECEWPWVFTSPGINAQPCASMWRKAESGGAEPRPTAAMRSPRIATQPTNGASTGADADDANADADM